MSPGGFHGQPPSYFCGVRLLSTILAQHQLLQLHQPSIELLTTMMSAVVLALLTGWLHMDHMDAPVISMADESAWVDAWSAHTKL